ncbi:MAG: NYN domain-containing protein [Planctomycetes bacterium]|nr:NYN domain-containing protein [Planctomycetota bacterium]
MDREFWLDGFNFFHHWDRTRGLLRSDSGLDIVRAIERSLRILGRHLGVKCRQTLVFLDGGLTRNETRLGDLRIRYCGPGKKADDRMLADLGELLDDARMVTAVSNDRELKGGLRSYGASCLGAGEFLALIEGKKGVSDHRFGKGGGKSGKVPPSSWERSEEARVMREKCRTLSESEIRAWLDYFGGEVEA